METIVSILEPFKAATKLLGGEKYITSSLTGRIFKNLLIYVEEYSNDSHFMKKFKSDIRTNLKKRNNVLGSIIFKAAALDPDIDL